MEIPKMNESGIDLGFDLTNLDTDQLLKEFENGDFLLVDDSSDSFYQLKSRPVSESPPNSLKSTNVATRTNLKQLLQMLQVQEQERKEMGTTKQTSSRCSGPTPQTSSTAAVSVPQGNTLPPRVDVPSEVLKVHSRLENPTRYHVMENRKRQVQEFLSTAQGNGRSLLTQSVPNGAPVALPTTTIDPPPAVPASLLSSSAPSPDSPNSVPLSSSAATSASEADVIESIIQMESSMDADSHNYGQPATLPTNANMLDVFVYGGTSSKLAKSCPPDITDKEETYGRLDPQLQALAKDRQKKDNHNMIERRRRFNINDRIKELATLLPKSNDPYYDVVRADRQNKGTILKASVDYIKELKKATTRLSNELANKRAVEQELWKLRLHNQQLLNMCANKSNSSSAPDISFPVPITFTKEEVEVLVKQEPLETDCETNFYHGTLDDLMEDDHPVTGDPMLCSTMDFMS